MESELPYDASSQPSVRWLWVPVPHEAEAERIAQHLLEQQLAACVNILPGMKSLYRWKGEICSDHEVAMIVKTHEIAYLSCEREIIARHSADLPCILSFEPQSGHAPFMAWVHEQIPSSANGGET